MVHVAQTSERVQTRHKCAAFRAAVTASIRQRQQRSNEWAVREPSERARERAEQSRVTSVQSAGFAVSRFHQSHNIVVPSSTSSSRSDTDIQRVVPSTLRVIGVENVAGRCIAEMSRRVSSSSHEFVGFGAQRFARRERLSAFPSRASRRQTYGSGPGAETEHFEQMWGGGERCCRCCSLRCQHQAADARTDRSGPFLGLKLRWGECGTRLHATATWPQWPL